MVIHTYESDLRAKTCAALIERCAAASGFGRILLLPIPSFRGGDAITTGESLESVAESAGEGALVVGYGIPEALRRRLEEADCTIIDSAEDESFLVENGELTADATLGILLTTETRAPRELSVGVVGYGRIGKRLTRVLLYLGCAVRVYTSRSGTRLELCEFGVASRMSIKDADLSGLDILINTAPQAIFNTGDGFPSELRVIDLASGSNFPGVAKVEKYPSLPAKALPVSAGRAWFRSVERELNKLKSERQEG